MNWKDIKVATDNTHFTFDGEPIFNKTFIEVLKFHSPGLAPVLDNSGAYHIDSNGMELYKDRYSRTFGFYDNLASVVFEKDWFHINQYGKKIYNETYSWIGNFQENYCAVKNQENQYFHIDTNGIRLYKENYKYVGDFKDGIACVKLENGLFKHINAQGAFINNKSFLDLGIFHKNFATAKDEKGWFHINKKGEELYSERYLLIEPFYNGYALVTKFNSNKVIINEVGDEVLKI